MTLVQLEYVTVIADSGSFVEAARRANVTQPALTTQVKNLESELDVLIFDRTKKPIVPTEIGSEIVQQARNIVQESRRIPDLVAEYNTEVKGNIKLGIIPTISPYIIPLFINEFNGKNPEINVHVQELITEEVIEKLKNGDLDVGIISTPVDAKNLLFVPLYYERMLGYVSSGHPYFFKDQLVPENLKEEDLWLLKEGNCFRNQTLNICSENDPVKFKHRFKFESHSIESLMRIVEVKKGLTIIPELATRSLSKKQMEMVKEIAQINPYREVSLVMNPRFLKKRLIDKMKRALLDSLPDHMKHKPQGSVIDTDVKA